MDKLKTFNLPTAVARRGFEPRQTEPKSVVLPLYYRAKLTPDLAGTATSLAFAKGVQK